MDFKGQVDADLKLNNFNLNDISEVLELKSPTMGIVSGNITLNGTSTEPIIKVNIDAQNLSFREFESDVTSLNVSYLNRRIDLKLNINKNAKEIFLSSVTVDVDLNSKKNW